jgi:hypothetical protein
MRLLIAGFQVRILVEQPLFITAPDGSGAISWN